MEFVVGISSFESKPILPYNGRFKEQSKRPSESLSDRAWNHQSPRIEAKHLLSIRAVPALRMLDKNVKTLYSKTRSRFHKKK
jgi:hypothetical protein